MVAQFLAQKPVNFASLTDSLIWFSKLMFETLILNANTKRLFGAEELSELSRNRPQAWKTLGHPRIAWNIPWWVGSRRNTLNCKHKAKKYKTIKDLKISSMNQ